MKTLIFTLVVAAACVPEVRAQAPLYSSDVFSVYPDHVVQGAFRADAPSDHSLTSNFRSPFQIPTKRIVDFKFSINGADNEQPVGQNHRVILPAHGGTLTAPLLRFGTPDEKNVTGVQDGEGDLLKESVDLTVRVDMRAILKDFAEKEWTVTPTGERINRDAFHGVFLAGGTPPLSWDFASLVNRSECELHDPDGDGVYEVVLHIPKDSPGAGEEVPPAWALSTDLSRFPSFHSPFVLVDALYAKALEELQQDVRSDGALMAGAMWPGVWTRDISYSIILSIAAVAPDAAKTSLMAKVKDDRIIQDTGTGGSWPISSDRMVWALAAWEVYVVTGDRSWLASSYRIIKNSADQDLHAVYDKTARLFRGESSFLDWREQTYPRWMDPKDIYESKNLGTNVVHVMALDVLGRMAGMLGESPEPYRSIARDVRQSINASFWIPSQHYYGQFLYGRKFMALSSKMEALGEALAVLGGVATPSRAGEIVSNVPVTPFGITCVYPQTPGLPPYHNDAVWPFVETFWGWASARAGNAAAVETALGSIYRSSALFMTNKENLVASTGDYRGTEINSSRQLWSVAGNLATIYRILYGMEFTPDSLVFSPFVPAAYAGEKILSGFRYRQSVLTVILRGHGSGAASVTLDGAPIKRAAIPATLMGAHTLVLTMNGTVASPAIHRVENAFAPETPVVTMTDSVLAWSKIPGADRYEIRANGMKIDETKAPHYGMPSTGEYAEFQVGAVDREGRSSFLSEPAVRVFGSKAKIIPPADRAEYAVRLDPASRTPVTFSLRCDRAGVYAVECLYANGNGPINTDNKCGIRTVMIDNVPAGVVVFPQRGVDRWNDWGYSNTLLLRLEPGEHTASLQYTAADKNMNGVENTALVRSLRFIYLHP